MKTDRDHTQDNGPRKRRPRTRSAKPGPAPSPTLTAAMDALTRFLKLPNYRRREIERTIDALIVVLDHMDDDPELEPEEDRCMACDDFGGITLNSDWRAGDPEDAEESGDMEPGEPEDAFATVPLRFREDIAA